MTPELERIMANDVASGIEARPLGELRDLRRRSQEWEQAVSLTRRLAQGRLDMLGYEVRRRAGEGPEDRPGLLFDLPDILAAEGRGGGGGRAVALEPPGPAADELAELLDGVVDPDELCHLDRVPSERLPELVERLQGFEHELSVLRRALHQRIDALQAEIGRRYRDGEASVESLLG